MANRPTIKLVDNPIAVGTVPAGDQTAEPAPEPKATRPRKIRQPPEPQAPTQPRDVVPEATPAATNPYAGMRKVQIPVRLFPPLWDRLDELVRVLRDENLDVDKTALLNALLHFNGPVTTDDARELVNRWRALLASPPPRPH